MTEVKKRHKNARSRSRVKNHGPKKMQNSVSCLFNIHVLTKILTIYAKFGKDSILIEIFNAAELGKLKNTIIQCILISSFLHICIPNIMNTNINGYFLFSMKKLKIKKKGQNLFLDNGDLKSQFRIEMFIGLFI